MTEVHHQTRKAADIALAKRTISRASYDALLAGEISLQAARDLGREGGPRASDVSVRPGTATQTSRSAAGGGADAPPRPPSRISKDDRSRLCICGCQRPTRGRFAPGHDQRLLKYAYEYVRGERELTEEQLEYVRDETDKLERARKRVEREDRKAEKKADS